MKAWDWIKSKFKKKASVEKPTVATQPKPETKTLIPKWMEIAKAELGESEIKGARHNPRIVDYHQATKGKYKDDETAWCASFVNWCLREAGVPGTNSAWARDWLNWGRKLDQPQFGCICVVERNGAGGDSHVFFWFGEADGKILALGGNQSDSVSISRYPKSKVLGYRWPKA